MLTKRILTVLLLIAGVLPATGQDIVADESTTGTVAATDEATATQEEVQSQESPDAPVRPWNSFSTKRVNGIFFGGLALDSARHLSQSAGSEDVIGDLEEFENPEIRVARLGLTGTLNSRKPIAYYVSAAYLGFGRGFNRKTDPSWSLFDYRLDIPVGQTGTVSVGKMKEPFSQERLMGGGWMPGIERAMGTEALTPARNVGVQLRKTMAKERMTWSLGVFNDWLETNEDFDRSSTQVVGRLTGLPLAEPDGRGLLHLAVAARHSDVKSGFVAFKTKPEVNLYPTVLEVDSFAADSMTHTLFEAYYKKKRFWFASEMLSARIESLEGGDPTFDSAWAQATWAVNGEARSYNFKQGIFGGAKPVRSVTEGGAGLFEVGARYSTLDLDDGRISGGEGSRLTGIVNWFLTNKQLVAFNYGYIDLDIAGVQITSHVVHMRLMLLW